MSYDIELKNKVTGETATMRHPQYVRGISISHIITAIIIMRQPTVTSDLHMIKFQHITLTEHMALLKPNTESAACMGRLPLNQSRC